MSVLVGRREKNIIEHPPARAGKSTASDTLVAPGRPHPQAGLASPPPPPLGPVSAPPLLLGLLLSPGRVDPVPGGRTAAAIWSSAI